MLLHASHPNRTQYGRGIVNKEMLETLPTLDVRQLAVWQLDAAQAIYRDFRPRQFQPCHHCVVDPGHGIPLARPAGRRTFNSRYETAPTARRPRPTVTGPWPVYAGQNSASRARRVCHSVDCW